LSPRQLPSASVPGSARAVGEVNECPADWALVPPPVPDAPPPEAIRLADRDGDGSVCQVRLVVSRHVLNVLTDKAIGNPGIIPPGPCTGPFSPLAIGNPNIFPGLRTIDVNGDGLLCAASRLSERALIIVLLDNSNVNPRRPVVPTKPKGELR
jgi:hypothetical protein